MRAKLLQPAANPKPMLDHHARVNKRAQAARKKAAEPEVGIFWVYQGRPIIDAVSVSQAQDYKEFKSHATGHYDFWRTLQRNGVVPTDVEYDEVPRGRVVYNNQARKYYLFADACIRKDPRMIDRIESDMGLPSKNTIVRSDPHYKCVGCQPKKTKEQLAQEDEDWDF